MAAGPVARSRAQIPLRLCFVLFLFLAKVKVESVISMHKKMRVCQLSKRQNLFEEDYQKFRRRKFRRQKFRRKKFRRRKFRRQKFRRRKFRRR